MTAPRREAISLLRANPPKGGDAELRGYRGRCPPSPAGPPANHRWRFFHVLDRRRPTATEHTGGRMRTKLYLAATLVVMMPAMGSAQTGNGAPSGPHFRLNMIGVALACGSTTVSLFATCLEGFFWQYDNNGLKLLQIRFYLNQP